jgi:hypothetical protein
MELSAAASIFATKIGSRSAWPTLSACTPALRREQIKLQVAHITSLIHVKGYAAPETKAATEHVR